jgi:SAM-dependent methyltransferase
LELARKRCAGSGIEFRVGVAEQLDLPDTSFDIVLNVEASHLYEDRPSFFAEAFRVLKPGGRFCYTDGCWADDDCTDDLLEAGFELIERAEITPNVMRALRLDNARREALFDTLPDCAQAARWLHSHRLERLEQVKAALARGAKTPQEVVDIVYTDVDPGLKWAAEWSARAQLDFLT